MRIKILGGGGGRAEYQVAVRPRQGGGCGKGQGGCAPSTQSMKKKIAGIYIKWEQYCIKN